MLSESFLASTCVLLTWSPCSLHTSVSCTCCPGWGVSVPPVHMLSVCSPPVLQKEEYHTHLAVLYLDEVLQQRPCTADKGAEVTETQAKLRRLLQESDLYRVHFLMGEWVHVASVDKRQRVGGGKGVVHEPVWHQVSLPEARGASYLSSALWTWTEPSSQ